ncbi:MAG: hypothetical protein ACRCXB_34195 [Aeromonadaceae bacterium]
MSKKMTPCEKLGYKVGDKFNVVTNSDGFDVGTVVEMIDDDGSICPLFRGFGSDGSILETYLNVIKPEGGYSKIDVIPFLKLKPAKQALADAIHQNGGRVDGAMFASQDKCALVVLFKSKPILHGNTWIDCEGFEEISSFEFGKSNNWHQAVLSRDEYFAAYPEQPKEGAMSSNWHKNGELPPVGEVCIFDPNGRTEFFDEKAISAIGKEVSIISHVKFKGGVRSVAVFMCDTGGIAIVRSANETCFRPLRTERDMVVDEMMRIAPSEAKWNVAFELFCGELYDQGYRKELSDEC